jgi:flagellar motor switch protein FliN
MIELPVYLTVSADAAGAQEKPAGAPRENEDSVSAAPPAPAAVEAVNLDLLLDIELQASLRFGGREMPLGEILELGPGDVISLDRPVEDPIDLVVGDRIVARGEVVLIDGCYGLRVLEVAEPRKRLETVRCLF